jgi:hypothetical protein
LAHRASCDPRRKVLTPTRLGVRHGRCSVAGASEIDVTSGAVPNLLERAPV